MSAGSSGRRGREDEFEMEFPGTWVNESRTLVYRVVPKCACSTPTSTSAQQVEVITMREGKRVVWLMASLSLVVAACAGASASEDDTTTTSEAVATTTTVPATTTTAARHEVRVGSSDLLELGASLSKPFSFGTVVSASVLGRRSAIRGAAGSAWSVRRVT